MTRDDALAGFAARIGWQEAAWVTVAGDASNRRYMRLTRPGGDTAILMDAPPDRGEDTRPFIRIAEYLCGLGLSAPRILHRDTEAGMLLIEDFGRRSLCTGGERPARDRKQSLFRRNRRAFGAAPTPAARRSCLL
ncbi:phosphotransferase [Roseovarius sp. C7]|uniref:phosphotransferase n=1 Tax=Roseovarius sp. C7 TaxID=3398643 RepID=UPI0039F6CA4A